MPQPVSLVFIFSVNVSSGILFLSSVDFKACNYSNCSCKQNCDSFRQDKALASSRL